jgi:hypothetical protein
MKYPPLCQNMELEYIELEKILRREELASHPAGLKGEILIES